MTPSKFRMVEGGLTQAARKVLGATPEQEAWPYIRIHQELMRIGEGGSRDVSVTLGCLQSLKESGLVKEPRRGEFARVDVRQKQERLIDELVTIGKQQQQQPIPTTPVQQPTVPMTTSLQIPTTRKLTPLEMLSNLEKRAQDLATLAKTLCDDIQATAITIEDQIANETANSNKLKQLQELLKSIGS